MRKLVGFLSCLFVVSAVEARPAQEGNWLAVGQGVSAPALTSPVNYSSGFTYSNSAVAAQLTRPLVSLQYDTGDDDAGADVDGVGAEVGLGSGRIGAKVGYYDRDCRDCDGRFGGILGFQSGSFALGLGYREEDTYSLGALFGGNGPHRIGLAADFFDADQDGQDLTSYGVGYSYLGNSWVFALDASKRDRDGAESNDVVQVTPGVVVSADWLAVSLSYDLYLNDDDGVFDDEIWFGLGFGGERAHLAVYHDYVNEWALVGTLRF